jgi:hypothetical protein
MDERTKSIFAIEQKKTEETSRLNDRLRILGRLLLEHLDDESIAIERDVYNKTNSEIARLNDCLTQIARDEARISEIDESLAQARTQNSESEHRLAILYPNLGKLVLRHEAFASFSVPYQWRTAVIQQKIDDFNRRLREMNEKDNPNVFAWIGKNAQSLVVKSFLAKTEVSLQRIYAEAGAEFIRNRPGSGRSESEELEAVYDCAQALRNENGARVSRIAELEKEKRRIQDSFGRDGSASRKKADINRQIAALRRELGNLYLRLGQKAEETLSETFKEVFNDEMRDVLEDTAHSRELVKDYGEQIIQLQVSLEIDNERAEIERIEKLIKDQRRRIAAAEEIIGRYRKRIDEANRRIGDLMNM